MLLLVCACVYVCECAWVCTTPECIIIGFFVSVCLLNLNKYYFALDFVHFDCLIFVRYHCKRNLLMCLSVVCHTVLENDTHKSISSKWIEQRKKDRWDPLSDMKGILLFSLGEPSKKGLFLCWLCPPLTRWTSPVANSHNHGLHLLCADRSWISTEISNNTDSEKSRGGNNNLSHR